ncbi:hypothetical protein A3H40_02625 [Candidatus Daviesbacteria bacterium RIFCSPLOWO2_02_FULL_38_15]|uniref:histidine kinase n=1 Tax=Candidatus Daviesbacteria bacterium RIFCSPLOWO2_02_FULL_38_15 TaxID=1797794 RepID=A0A1F5N590_9BACT|nr:MAG: hypothetical protein A3H40_02625 [Candidatus Daviesbacteria bacterium RIFCSPLOWO2_02_FULL_38_15]
MILSNIQAIILFIYFFTIFLNLFLAFFIFFKNKKSRVNQIFFLFSISISLWIITLFLFYNFTSGKVVLILGRLNFIFAEILVVFLFLFSNIFPRIKFRLGLYARLLILIESITISIITGLTDLIDKNEIIEGLSRITEYGELYILFILHFLSYTIIGIGILFWKLRNYKDIEKAQIKFVLLGIFFGIVFGSMTNIIIPYVFGNYDIQNFGPVATIILIIFIVYAILKHHLFNIKVVTVELLTGATWMILGIQIIKSNSVGEIIFQSGLFLVFSFLSYFLIRGILKEEHLARQQYEMVATVSHQLRTPLTPVVGLASMIAEGDYKEGTEEKKEAESRILIAAQRLRNVINDFLEMFELEGDRKRTVQQVDVVDTIKAAMENVKQNYQSKKHYLKFKNPKKIAPKIVGEQRLLVQAITNLLDNAEKYTEKGGTTITLEPKNHRFLIRITDTGIGLDNHDKQRLFEKFYRSEAARKIRPDGSGLGLPIVKKILEDHGAKITAESSGRDKGTIFTIDFRKI